MKNKEIFKDNCVSFFKDNLGKLYICIYVLQMYLGQYLMIYLWPKCVKNVGWGILHVDFVPGFTTVPKMLTNISSVISILMKKSTGATSQLCNCCVHIVKGTQIWKR